MARAGPPAMSAVRSLTGVNRTCGGPATLVEIDPQRTLTACREATRVEPLDLFRETQLSLICLLIEQEGGA
jgi:hypothetical protein